MTYTSRKPVKPGIWDWMCLVQESRHVVPWPRDGPRLENEREDVRGSADGPQSKPPRGSGGRGLGRRKLMVLRRWVRRLHGLRKRGQERLKLHNAEVEAGCLTTAIALLHPNADPAVQVPCNLIRQWLIFWEHNHRLRPYIGKVWAKIATAMMARSPATRWRYVRGHLSAVIVTLMQHNWVPIRHTSWKDPEGSRWTLKAGGVGIDDWGFLASLPCFD